MQKYSVLVAGGGSTFTPGIVLMLLQLLEALGGSENIAEVNNCATRLRISVKDEHRVMNDATFRQIGAHGVVRNKDAIQVIIGLSVPQVRDSMENLMKLNA